MSNFSEQYKSIINDIENTISDKKEREVVLNKVNDISYMFMDMIDRITKLDDTRLEQLEKKQEKVIDTLSKIRDIVNLIKSDIYEEDGYDFEIVCPYCNYEFVADIESELREEVECPKCHNVIEIDWDEDVDNCCLEENNCSGCSGCSSKNTEKNRENDRSKTNNIININPSNEDFEDNCNEDYEDDDDM